MNYEGSGKELLHTPDKPSAFTTGNRSYAMTPQLQSPATVYTGHSKSADLAVILLYIAYRIYDKQFECLYLHWAMAAFNHVHCSLGFFI